MTAADPHVSPAVLVVTRDPALFDDLHSLLRARGRPVVHVTDLTTGYDRARIGLTILDTCDLVGVEEALAQLPRPILALTDDDGRAEALVGAGASDFAVLPCSRAVLSARISAALKLRERVVPALSDSQGSLQTLLANLPGVVYRCANDPEWSMQFISEGCYDLTGYAPDEFTSGRVHFAGLVHHEDRDRVREQVQQALADRRPFRVTYRLHTASGACKWLWAQGQGVLDAAGEPMAMEGVITDLSELRQTKLELEEREVLLETLLAVTETAYILCDEHGAVDYANLAAQTWLKLPDSRLVGARFADLLTSLPNELREAVGRGRDSIFTVDHQGGDFEAYHLVMRNVQISGRPHTAYAFKRLTRELARQEVEVWKKVIRLIAHEINNTLAPISSLLHSARLINAAEARDARLDRIIDTISERSKHLGEFLKGYTQFARLPRPRLESTKWRSLIDRLDELVQFKIDAAPEDLNTVNAVDRSQIEQALINLLKNAVEAGGPPEEVTLRLRAHREGDEIQVLDRGPGIPPELLPKVLLPFYSTKRTGTGLGLPLCREIIDAHGGNLRIEAREGGGTAVILWLPRLAAA
ncbi:PAS domain S-box-containing protein [Nannocystis exedens]|uniref:histidine kinase n=1 Tax=Nannocystis exedens TaxID=54 RepID=A0A1I1SRQ7_9BACT|nr:ATP-binding protein [Nannocystis exedens]PCC75676.1 histidine kinase [Nannocystis exedens]SFD49021.1 PAS domain S-box-containing protein [Nannocystis exedens]